ncbi:hypothetical protein J6590_064447 [Homalodisca vitripennis]|nr:hypothetical protein J6590_064447 [Homalodisca vitripennis]
MTHPKQGHSTKVISITQPKQGQSTHVMPITHRKLGQSTQVMSKYHPKQGQSTQKRDRALKCKSCHYSRSGTLVLVVGETVLFCSLVSGAYSSRPSPHNLRLHLVGIAMGDQRVERRLVYSRPQWASFQANGGVPRSPPPPASPPPHSPPPSANQRPVLNPVEVCDLICKVRGKTLLEAAAEDNLMTEP